MLSRDLAIKIAVRFPPPSLSSTITIQDSRIDTHNHCSIHQTYRYPSLFLDTLDTLDLLHWLPTRVQGKKHTYLHTTAVSSTFYSNVTVSHTVLSHTTMSPSAVSPTTISHLITSPARLQQRHVQLSRLQQFHI